MPRIKLSNKLDIIIFQISVQLRIADQDILQNISIHCFC